MRHLVFCLLILVVVSFSGCRNNGWFSCDGYLDPGYCSPSNPMNMPANNMVPVQPQPGVWHPENIKTNGPIQITPGTNGTTPTPIQGQAANPNQVFGYPSPQTGGQVFQGSFVQ